MLRKEIFNLHKNVKGHLNTTVNGVSLEKEIPGFQTLNTYGRGTVERKVTLSKGSGTGVTLIKNNFGSREISIEFWIKTDSNKHLMDRYERLNKILSTDVLDVQFSDEDFHYFCVVTDLGDTKSATNWVTGEIELTCMDPYKYSDSKELRFKRSTIFNYEYLHEAVADEILVTLKDACETVKITNAKNGDSIILNGVFEKNDTILIDMRKGLVYQNKMLNMKILNLRSDFEEFRLNFGDEIVVTGTDNDMCSIKYRERRI